VLKNAATVIASGDVSMIVDLAIEANRQINAAKEALELAKTWLRKHARKETETGSVEFDGNLGTAQVVIPELRPAAKSGVDLPACVKVLPKEMVDRIFIVETKTTVDFATDFEARVASLPTEQQMAVWNLIKMADQTPRVVLPK